MFHQVASAVVLNRFAGSELQGIAPVARGPPLFTYLYRRIRHYCRSSHFFNFKGNPCTVLAAPYDSAEPWLKTNGIYCLDKGVFNLLIPAPFPCSFYIYRSTSYVRSYRENIDSKMLYRTLDWSVQFGIHRPLDIL